MQHYDPVTFIQKYHCRHELTYLQRIVFEVLWRNLWDLRLDAHHSSKTSCKAVTISSTIALVVLCRLQLLQA